MLFRWAGHSVQYTKTATLNNGINIKLYDGAVSGDYTQWLELLAMEDTSQSNEFSMCKREKVSQMRPGDTYGAVLFVGSAIGVSSLHSRAYPACHAYTWTLVLSKMHYKIQQNCWNYRNKYAWAKHQNAHYLVVPVGICTITSGMSYVLYVFLLVCVHHSKLLPLAKIDDC